MLKKNKIIIIVIIIIIILCIILYNYYKNKDNFKNINEHFYDSPSMYAMATDDQNKAYYAVIPTNVTPETDITWTHVGLNIYSISISNNLALSIDGGIMWYTLTPAIWQSTPGITNWKPMKCNLENIYFKTVSFDGYKMNAMATDDKNRAFYAEIPTTPPPPPNNTLTWKHVGVSIYSISISNNLALSIDGGLMWYTLTPAIWRDSNDRTNWKVMKSIPENIYFKTVSFDGYKMTAMATDNQNKIYYATIPSIPPPEPNNVLTWTHVGNVTNSVAISNNVALCVDLVGKAWYTLNPAVWYNGPENNWKEFKSNPTGIKFKTISFDNKQNTSTPTISLSVSSSLPSNTMIANIPDSNTPTINNAPITQSVNPARIYSSVYPQNICEKSSLTSSGSWCPIINTNIPNHFLQLILDKYQNVSGFAIMPRSDSLQYVTACNIKYLDNNGQTVNINTDITNGFNTGLANLTENSKQQTSYIIFTPPIYTNSIIIYPTKFVIWPSMRCDLLLPIVPTITRSPSQPQPQPTAIITANKIVLNNVNTPNIIIDGTNYGKILEISQLAVYSMINGVKTNVATKGTATSSSVYTPPSTDQRVYSASNAIDGVLQIKNHTDDKPPFCSKSISSNTIGETWTLTLDKTYTIDSIVFYNRADCCQERANGVTVKFYNNSSLTVPVGTYTLNSELIQKIQIAPPPPPTTTKPPRIMPTIPEYILPPVNPAVSPIIIPNIPIVTGYEYNNSSIKDALDSSYTDIQKERNTNLDNQSRIDSLDKRIKKLKMDVIGLNKSSSYNSDIKPPKFY